MCIKEKKMSGYIDELLRGVDCEDVNTIPGCLNRLNRLMLEKNKQLMSEKYIFDESIDEISYKFWKKQESQFWTNDEMIKFSFDREDYKRADDRITRAIDLILSFFASGDGIITSNLAFRFFFDAKNSVELSALILQAHQESIHAENYNLALTTIIGDEEKIMKLRNKVDESSCVRDKAIMVEKFMYANLPVAYRLIAFAATEGIFFWSSFTVLFWFRQQTNDQQKMPFEGLVESNLQISRDESLHRDYGVARYLKLPPNERLPQDIVHKIIHEFVEIEKRFAEEILPEPYKDLDANEVKKFVEYMADNLLSGLKYDRLYGREKAPDTLPWMPLGSRGGKPNFYEVQPLTYKEQPSHDDHKDINIYEDGLINDIEF